MPQVRPQWQVEESGLIEIIDADDAEVAASEYSKSVEIPLGASVSGEILDVVLISSEAGSGAAFQNPGTLYFFDSDPTVTSGATALAAAGADLKLAIGKVELATADWTGDATGYVAYKAVAIGFHEVSSLYAVFQLGSAGSAINSAAGDDEELHLNLWYRRDS